MRRLPIAIVLVCLDVSRALADDAANRPATQLVVDVNFELSDGRRPASFGSSGALAGRICVVDVFIADDRTYWSEREKRLLEPSIARGLAFLQREGRRHGIDLRWQRVRADVLFDGVVPVDTGDHSWTSEILDLSESRRARCGLDTSGTITLIHVNKVGRSYALDDAFYSRERAVIFNRPITTFYSAADPRSIPRLTFVEGPETIAHEVLHLFGAEDLYEPDSVRQHADLHYPDDVMRLGVGPERLRVRELTAERVGWR